MASMYDELMKEVEPAVDQLKLDINAALDKYRDIDVSGWLRRRGCGVVRVDRYRDSGVSVL